LKWDGKKLCCSIEYQISSATLVILELEGLGAMFCFHTGGNRMWGGCWKKEKAFPLNWKNNKLLSVQSLKLGLRIVVKSINYFF
jgi:hypothetical protein